MLFACCGLMKSTPLFEFLLELEFYAFSHLLLFLPGMGKLCLTNLYQKCHLETADDMPGNTLEIMVWVSRM